MKKSIAFTVQKSLVYSFIVIAVLLFVVGLGFMTNYYVLFYNGTNEMYEFYNSLQVLNKAIFDGAVMLVILGVLYLGFDINKEINGWIGAAYVAGVTIYTVMTARIIMRAVPHYKGIYNEFDFTVIEDYIPSTYVFDMALILYILALVVASLISVIVVVRLVQRLRGKGKAVQL